MQVNTHHFQRLHLHLHPQAGTDLCRHNCTCTFTCGSTYAFVFDTSTALIPATSTRCRGRQRGQTGGYPCVSNRYTVKHNHISYVLCRYTCYKIHCRLHPHLHLHTQTQASNTKGDNLCIRHDEMFWIYSANTHTSFPAPAPTGRH